jgi:hypothetical protein
VGGDQRVEDAVGEGEVVDRGSVRLFGVDVGGAPLQRAIAVAGGEQVVGAEVDGDGTEGGELAEQLLPLGA